MKDSILIFDEAHNVLTSARDENTIHFNPNLKDKAEKHIEIIRKELAPSLQDMDTLTMDQCLSDHLKYIKGMRLLFDELAE